jgi:hypothetical protein
MASILDSGRQSRPARAARDANPTQVITTAQDDIDLSAGCACYHL